LKKRQGRVIIEKANNNFGSPAERRNI